MAVIIQNEPKTLLGDYDFNRGYVYLISAVVALGGVLFGFDLVIISGIRGSALALATLALWIANFFTTFLFPIMNRHFGLSVTFMIHAGICFIYFLFVRSKAPETKGKSLEEIESLLKKSA